MQSPQRLARIAGLLYLAVAVLGGSAMIVRTRFYEPGDPATTADNLTADAGLFRFAVAANLAASMCWLFTAMALYLLFKHVNANWAGAMVIFAAAGATMELLNMAHEVVALVVATNASDTGASADALVLLMFDLCQAHRTSQTGADVTFGDERFAADPCTGRRLDPTS